MYNLRRTSAFTQPDMPGAEVTRTRRRYNFNSEINYFDRSDEYSRILSRNLERELELTSKSNSGHFLSTGRHHGSKGSSGTKLVTKRSPMYRLRRVFQPVFLLRSLITILCVVGFVYQSTDFFLGFFRFPTTTNIRVESMKDLVFPSLTVCIANWVSRTKELCMNDTTTINLVDALWAREKISQLALSTQDIVKHCQMKPTSGCEPFACDEHWQFAYSRFPDSMCYSLDLHAIEDRNHPLHKCKYPWDYELDITIGWEEQDNLKMSSLYKADAVFHQVGTNSAGQLHPLFFEPGARYIILVEQFTILALPPPYQTQCVEYDAMPRSKMFYGQVTQNLCYEMCKAVLWNSHCKCVSPRYAYRDRYPTVCNQQATKKCAKIDIDHHFTDQCIRQCRQPCKEVTYDIQVTAQGQKEGKAMVGPAVVENVEEDYYENEGEHTVDPANETEVVLPTRREFSLTVMFASEKHTILQHMRKFTFIEVFGYLGGYVGIWLGMSFFSVLDDFIVYLQKQCRQRKRDREEAKLQSGKPENSEVRPPNPGRISNRVAPSDRF